MAGAGKLVGQPAYLMQYLLAELGMHVSPACKHRLRRFPGCLKGPRCLLLAQGCPDPAAPYGSAYWGAPAARKCAGELADAAESGPNRRSIRSTF